MRLNLLLLLSALLSALSGTGGVRAAQAQMPAATLSSTAARVADSVTATRVRKVAQRPSVAFSSPGLAVTRTIRAMALPAIIPAFASRRRE